MKLKNNHPKKIYQKRSIGVCKNDISSKTPKRRVSTYNVRHRRMGNSAKESRHHGVKRREEESE